MKSLTHPRKIGRPWLVLPPFAGSLLLLGFIACDKSPTEPGGGRSGSERSSTASVQNSAAESLPVFNNLRGREGNPIWEVS
jgi:hypothetical protein